MTNTENTEAPFSVTVKAGTAQYAPQFTIRANTADELLSRLISLDPDVASLGDDISVKDAAASFAAGVIATWVKVSTVLEGVVPTPGKPNGGPAAVGAVTGGTGNPAAVNDGSQRVETDKWGGVFTHNHPKAPPSPHGTMVLREWTAQSGKKMARWVDPRDPKIPSVYAVNGKDAPADLSEGDWAKV